MLTKISPRKDDLIGRIIVQVITIICFCFIVYIIAYPQANHYHSFLHDEHQPYKDWGFVIFLFICLALNLLHLLFIPYWVIIDEEFKTITIKYLLTKPRVIALNSISNYTDVTLSTRFAAASGIVLYLPQEKRILLSEINVDDYIQVKAFLDMSNVENAGYEKFSYLAYYMHQ